MNTLPIGWRVLAHVVTMAVIAFLVAPILAIIPASFNKASFIRLPPQAWSPIWYARFFAEPEWLRALLNSLKFAVLCTAIAVPAGTLAAFALARSTPAVRMIATGLLMAPMVVPEIVAAVGIYRSALDFSVHGTVLAVALSHAVMALPFVVINVSISLRAVDPAWPLAAAGLGAGPWRVFRTVTLPNIIPGIAGGAVFAFMTSFDETVLTIFLSDYQTKTLPVKLWETVRLEFTPILAVATTLMIALSVILFVVIQMLSSRQKGESS